MGDIAYIFAPENCDFCKMDDLEVQAQFDGKTIHGPWAYMCEAHFEVFGIGLGTGRGQKLIVGERPKGDQSDADVEEYDAALPEPASDELTEGKEELPAANSDTPSPTKDAPDNEGNDVRKNLTMDWGNLWP